MLDARETGAKVARPPRASTSWAARPSQPEHFFGLDGNVRDVYSRVVYGARVSLLIGFVTVGVAIVIGTLIGADRRLRRRLARQPRSCG